MFVIAVAVVRDIATLAVTATGLVMMHLYLKQRELDVLADDDSLKAHMAQATSMVSTGNNR
jgi:hypothetical protein